MKTLHYVILTEPYYVLRSNTTIFGELAECCRDAGVKVGCLGLCDGASIGSAMSMDINLGSCQEHVDVIKRCQSLGKKQEYILIKYG